MNPPSGNKKGPPGKQAYIIFHQPEKNYEWMVPPLEVIVAMNTAYSGERVFQ
jgi:hypothetical protein